MSGLASSSPAFCNASANTITVCGCVYVITFSPLTCATRQPDYRLRSETRHLGKKGDRTAITLSRIQTSVGCIHPFTYPSLDPFLLCSMPIIFLHLFSEYSKFSLFLLPSLFLLISFYFSNISFLLAKFFHFLFPTIRSTLLFLS